LHWSGNFDEVQDFENQIRQLAGGTGLMSDADFNAGTRNQPLGERKAGISPDLDALAAYVTSLNRFDVSPIRPTPTVLSAAGAQGRALFGQFGCNRCHGGEGYTGSGADLLASIGTLKPASGSRNYAPLAGVDIPTLRDVWATAPYLHDGSAATLQTAIRAHQGISLGDPQADALAAYLREIGSDEAPPPLPPGYGTGLRAEYFGNLQGQGAPVLRRIEAINFAWAGAPGPRVPAANFFVRWSGVIEAPVTGLYRFRTSSDNAVRMLVDGVPVIDNFTDHAVTADTSAPVGLTGGQWSSITIEYASNQTGGVARLLWQPPGATGFEVVPAGRMYAD
jgi:mono/diheme cytochrome c family protein